MSKVIEITDQNFEEEILNSDVPTENWLEVPILAGEKNYPLSKGH
jgi:hypothetical protein